jgi:hypothetical protein
MTHPINQPVYDLVQQAIGFMDDFLRDRIDLPTYAEKLKDLDADSLLERYRHDFKQDPGLVYYLDALMILSSLQHELDFQVTEYGASVASEDIRMLTDLLQKFDAKAQKNSV